MPFVKGQSGNPKGRAPKLETLYAREMAQARANFGHALVPVSNHAIDLATGVYCFALLDMKTGAYKPPPADADPAVLLALGEPLVRVYRTPPDLAAITLVIERIMGKVPVPVDVKMERAISQVKADHALIARVLQEHVPPDALGPVVAELERVARHRESQTGLVTA